MVTFLSAVLERPIPRAGEIFTVSTFSASVSTALDNYQFEIPLNDDFLLEYVSAPPGPGCGQNWLMQGRTGAG